MNYRQHDALHLKLDFNFIIVFFRCIFQGKKSDDSSRIYYESIICFHFEHLFSLFRQLNRIDPRSTSASSIG